MESTTGEVTPVIAMPPASRLLTVTALLSQYPAALDSERHGDEMGEYARKGSRDGGVVEWVKPIDVVPAELLNFAREFTCHCRPRSLGMVDAQ